MLHFSVIIIEERLNGETMLSWLAQDRCLGISHFLQRLVSGMLLERGRIGESWFQRWKLHLNTPPFTVPDAE
jgi:hypothetical protein